MGTQLVWDINSTKNESEYSPTNMMRIMDLLWPLETSGEKHRVSVEQIYLSKPTEPMMKLLMETFRIASSLMGSSYMLCALCGS
jgi:hypothetical protein